MQTSVLDRVKMFLPEIRKANEELTEKIQKEGAESVMIDSKLAPSSSAKKLQVCFSSESNDNLN